MKFLPDRLFIAIFLGVSVLSVALYGKLGFAQERANTAPFIVGTTEAPPFAMKGEDGRWNGIAIELWRQVADKAGLSFEFRDTPFQELLEKVATNELDAAVAALTITSDRERIVDFSHAFYTTGLAIAVPREHTSSSWMQVFKRFLSLDFLLVVLLLSVVLLVAGMMIWLFERRHNPDMFGGNAASGIGSGFWWSAVTMTTVGYGDKAPKTCGGRVVAIIWMFTSIIIISSFTAAITTSLTVGELEGTIRGLEDLRSARVGAVTGSSSEAFLREEGIRTRPIPSTRDGLSSLADGRLDAIVQDAPILKFLVANNFADELKIIPKTFSRQDYGIALPVGSTRRETLNRELLEVIASPEWRRLVQHYISDS